MHGPVRQVRTPRPRAPGSATGGKAPSAAAFRRQRDVLAGAAYRECGPLRHRPGDSMVTFAPCWVMPMSIFWERSGSRRRLRHLTLLVCFVFGCAGSACKVAA